MNRAHRSALIPCAVVIAGMVAAGLTGLEGSARAEIVGGSVSAGGSGGAGIGVGVSRFVAGFTGAQVVYDVPKWHIEGLIAFRTNSVNNQRTTDFDFGFSGWYHLNLGASSDFSLGGGFALVTQSGGVPSAVAEVVEPGALIRAFVTPNVAIHARIAFPLIFGDDVGNISSSVSFNGQLVADFGFTYFFR